MRVTIFGSGYVGLVTGICLADAGNQVLCADIDGEKIAMLKNGEPPIYEVGLQELLRRNIENGRIEFTMDLKQAVLHGEVQFITVGTPSSATGAADLKYIKSVAKTIGEYLKDYAVIVNKSTVPVKSADMVKKIIQMELDKRHTRVEFDVVSNPEFLKEGAAITDFINPDRIIIGSENERAEKLMKQLYLPFDSTGRKTMLMDVRSAELTKYASNAFLATKISFMNEMSKIAESYSADINLIRQGMGADPRIGSEFLYAGCGYGGSCFPKDVRALVRMAENFGITSPLLHATNTVNERQKRVLFQKISAYFEGNLADKTFALWGLAFKPNTDDMREAASRVLMELLWEQDAKVQAYDPVAMPEAQAIYGDRSDLVLCETAEKTLENADALIVVTEWDQFKNPDFAQLKKLLKKPVIFDGRNLYDIKRLKQMDFEYFAIGRGDELCLQKKVTLG